MTIMPAVMGKLFLPLPYKEIVTNDKPATGKIRISFGADKLKMGISRADIATFFLNEIEAEDYIKSMPIIGS